MNPLLNRWVSADPLAVHGLGADPNLYAYVSGRVLASVDPLGLDDEPVGVYATFCGGGDCIRDGAHPYSDRPVIPEDGGSSGGGQGFFPKISTATALPEKAQRSKPQTSPRSSKASGQNAPDPEKRSLGRRLFQDFVPLAGSWDVMHYDQNATDDEKGAALLTFTAEAGTMGVGSGAKAGVRAAQWGYRASKGMYSTFKQAGKRTLDLLRGACKDGVCPCFSAGTLVDVDGAQAPIEDVKLGDRVGPESVACGEIDFSSWQVAVLRMVVWNAGEPDELEVQLLRPSEWFAAHRVVVGGYVDVSLDELNVSGRAYVTYAGASAEVAPGQRCPATGLIRHVSRDLIEVDLEGIAEPLEVTRRHPLYSASRDAWVAAEDLLVGERLRTLQGDRTVVAVDLAGLPAQEVFNLEVIAEHYYYVGPVGVWAHNTYGDNGARALWKITKEGTDRVVKWGERTYSRHKSTKHWWSRDTAGHGESVWKVYEGKGDGLHHIADADEFGDYLKGKHKGPVGKFIPWSQLEGKK